MAVKLEQRTAADQVLKLVSLTDSAIDWDKSFQGSGLEEPRKKLKYQKEHDSGELAFKPKDTPTIFVFRHPKRVDASRAVRATYTNVLRGGDKDLYTDVWQDNFVGIQEGFEAVQLNAPRHGEDGKLSDKYVQTLIDSEVFEELALAYIAVANRPGDGSLRQKK